MSIEFNQISTPDLVDQYSEDLSSVGTAIQILDSIFYSFGGRKKFYGQITTIKCYEDNSLVKSQLAEIGTGRVLLVDGGGSMRCALLGDNIAANAVKNGWSGVIIFGCVRDVDELALMDLGVYALAAYPRKSVRKGVGELNVQVQFAGSVIYPHQYAYVDQNGILISARSLY